MQQNWYGVLLGCFLSGPWLLPGGLLIQGIQVNITVA